MQTSPSSSRARLAIVVAAATLVAPTWPCVAQALNDSRADSTQAEPTQAGSTKGEPRDAKNAATAGVVREAVGAPAQGSSYVRVVAQLDRLTLDELLAGVKIAGPTLVRLVRADGGAELGVVLNPIRSEQGLEYSCGPAWVSWLSGDEPKFDPELLALPFARIRMGADGLPTAVVGGGPAAKFVRSEEGGEEPSDEHAGAAPSSPNGAAPCVPTQPLAPTGEERDVPVWGHPSRVAQIHRSALAGFEIASKVEAGKPEIADATEEERAEIDAAWDALEARAKRWLGRRVDAPPPYGSASIAWIEWMDARQALLRVRGEVEEADRVVQAIAGHLRRSGIPQLDALLSARVPRGVRGFHSLCWTPCWAAEAGEVRAATMRLAAEQQDFHQEVVEAVRRAKPCRAAFVEDASRPLGWLVGQLPNGARVDEAMREAISRRVEEYCDRDEVFIHYPVIIGDYAATLALEVWTLAWRNALEDCPEHRAAMKRWRDELLAMFLRVIEDTEDIAKAIPDPRIDPTSRRDEVMQGLAEFIDTFMGMRENYLFAFPGDDVTLNRIERQLRHNLGRRQDSYPYVLEEVDYPAHYPPEIVEAGRKFVLRSFVNLLRNDLTFAMYEACTEGDAWKTYPQPFSMRYASYGGVWRWRIGLQ
ncbi:MAG: hypothetical protein GC172_07350 [Phycisphaera sp.]|nr:hypothetical protein [Phycisphaera sp.]